MISLENDWSLTLPVSHHLIDLESELTLDSGKEVYRTKFRGNAKNLKRNTFCNVIESVLDAVEVIESDFSETDFKDCVFRNSSFTKCTFDVLTFATNIYLGGRFNTCSFSNSTFQNCTFRGTIFEGCDFSKLLIKECRFENCEFNNCVTTNKLFEMCLIMDSRFYKTDIQVDTIVSNFGLKSENLNDCHIRSGRVDDNPYWVDSKRLRVTSEKYAFAASALTEMRLDYFENGNFIEESFGLDRALNADSWQDVSRSPGSFLHTYQGFADFLILLYEADGLYFHTILKLHDLSSAFQTWCDKWPLSMAAPFMGIHQRLSRCVENVFLKVNEMTEMRESHLDLLVQGPTDEAAVQDTLFPLFKEEGAVSISRLEPQNSPWYLDLAFTAKHHLWKAILLVFATRLQSQIVIVPPKKARKGTSKASPAQAAFNIGPLMEPNAPFGYGLTLLLPKQRLLELKLSFDSKLLTKMAAFLIAFN